MSTYWQTACIKVETQEGDDAWHNRRIINDWRQKKPGQHQHIHDHQRVTIEDIERAQNQRNAQDKEGLRQNDKGQRPEPRAKGGLKDQQRGKEYNKGQQKVDQIGQDTGNRQHLTRESRPF